MDGRIKSCRDDQSSQSKDRAKSRERLVILVLTLLQLRPSANISSDPLIECAYAYCRVE